MWKEFFLIYKNCVGEKLSFLREEGFFKIRQKYIKRTNCFKKLNKFYTLKLNKFTKEHGKVKYKSQAGWRILQCILVKKD